MLGRDFLLELIGHYRALAWDHLCRRQSATYTVSGTTDDLAELAHQFVADEQAVVIGAQHAWAEDTLDALKDISTGGAP